MDFGIASVAGITVICYLIGQIIKATGLDNKWIPCIVGTAGAALGAVGMYVMPDFPGALCPAWPPPARISWAGS